MNYFDEYLPDAKKWVKEIGTVKGDPDICPADALVILCHYLERGYQRAQTVNSRSRWLRLVCGYLLTAMEFDKPTPAAPHADSAEN